MILRPTAAADIKALQALDLSYSTSWVWQMEQKVSGEETVSSFRPVRLPRPTKVLPPNGWSEALKDWKSSDLFIVAAEGKEIHGFLEARVNDPQDVAWIEGLGVASHRRRRGIATALVAEAQSWARSQNLRALMAQTQTKNYPAIRLLSRCGFTFCGFNDRYYATKDIAVFFCYNLG